MIWELCDVILGVIFFTATVSNSLVLLVFYRRPGLRTLSNRFVMNLLGTNLLSCWMLVPMVVAAPEFAGVSAFCRVCRLLSTGLCTASIFSVLLIGIDQYYAVIDPLHYHSKINNTRSVVLISLAWVVSIIVAVVGMMLGGKAAWNWCDQADTVPEIFVSMFALFFFTFVFLLPFCSICWIYISIYSAAHRNSQRTRRNGSRAGSHVGNLSLADSHEYMIVPTTALDSTSTTTIDSTSKLLSPSSTKGSIRSTSSFIVNSLRYRISNASLFRYREETRAARISALVIVLALVCWLPFSLVILLDSPLFDMLVSADWGKLSLTLLAASSIISPLLFAHRNRRIQRDLRKIFGIGRKSPGNVLRTHDQRKLSESQRNAHKVPVPNLSSTALELVESLTEATNESYCLPPSKSFLNRVIQNTSRESLMRVFSKLSNSKTDIKVPEVAVEIDTSRSSFSSGASTSTQRSTSAASISDVAEEL